MNIGSVCLNFYIERKKRRIIVDTKWSVNTIIAVIENTTKIKVEINYIKNSFFSSSTLSMRENHSRLTVSTMEKVNFVRSLSRPKIKQCCLCLKWVPVHTKCLNCESRGRSIFCNNSEKYDDECIFYQDYHQFTVITTFSTYILPYLYKDHTVLFICSMLKHIIGGYICTLLW